MSERTVAEAISPSAMTAKPSESASLRAFICGFIVSAPIGIFLLFTVSAAGTPQVSLIFWLTLPVTLLFWLIAKRRKRGRP